MPRNKANKFKVPKSGNRAKDIKSNGTSAPVSKRNMAKVPKHTVNTDFNQASNLRSFRNPKRGRSS